MSRTNKIYWGTYFVACAVFGYISKSLGLPLEAVIVTVAICTPVAWFCKRLADTITNRLAQEKHS